VLSALAGAAQELGDAIIINPYEIEGFTSALERALDMPREERRVRMRALRRGLSGKRDRPLCTSRRSASLLSRPGRASLHEQFAAVRSQQLRRVSEGCRFGGWRRAPSEDHQFTHGASVA